jgi:hypothetical protein
MTTFAIKYLAVFLKRFQARIGQVLEEVDPRKETYVEHTDRPWLIRHKTSEASLRRERNLATISRSSRVS